MIIYSIVFFKLIDQIYISIFSFIDTMSFLWCELALTKGQDQKLILQITEKSQWIHKRVESRKLSRRTSYDRVSDLYVRHSNGYKNTF